MDIDFWTLIEIVSTITGIVCVWLQTKEKILAWPFGILSVSLAAVIFIRSQLYSDFILHIIFLILNIYGWHVWSKKDSDQKSVTVEVLSNIRRLLLIPIILSITLIWGYLVDRVTDAALPYWDSFTTTGSLVAQYLLARKVLENWVIWIVVDIVAINIYLIKGLYYFSFLFFVYLILCTIGFVQWRREMVNNADYMASSANTR